MSDGQFADLTAAVRPLHAYIVCADSESRRMAAAFELAAGRVCDSHSGRPCHVCNACRKVFSKNHPDIIEIERLPDSKGKPRREILVDQIRAMTADAYVLPNEAPCKIYIVTAADALNSSAQNAMLKLLEEPPPYCLFILCTANPESLLPTVRSRCGLLNAGDGTGTQTDSGSAPVDAAAFLALCAKGDLPGLLEFCVRHEGFDALQTAEFVTAALSLLTDIICGRLNHPLNRRHASHLLALMSRAEDYLRQNVGIKHIFGVFSAKALSPEPWLSGND